MPLVERLDKNNEWVQVVSCRKIKDLEEALHYSMKKYHQAWRYAKRFRAIDSKKINISSIGPLKRAKRIMTIEELLGKGSNIHQIAKKLNMSESSIYKDKQLLQQVNFGDYEDEKTLMATAIRKLFDKGLSSKQVAREIGISVESVHEYKMKLLEMGIFYSPINADFEG